MSLVSEGTVGELPNQPNGLGNVTGSEGDVSRNGTVSSKRGFRRLSSLMRR